MKVKDLLTDESKWTKDAYAKDMEGRTVDVHSQDAVCFCLVGALARCYDDDTGVPYHDAYLKVAERVSPTAWNDAPERTFAEVRQLIEELDI